MIRRKEEKEEKKRRSLPSSFPFSSFLIAAASIGRAKADFRDLCYLLAGEAK